MSGKSQPETIVAASISLSTEPPFLWCQNTLLLEERRCFLPQIMSGTVLQHGLLVINIEGKARELQKLQKQDIEDRNFFML